MKATIDNKKPRIYGVLSDVMALGFEPRTACLEGRCSIQLSYATIFKDGCKCIKNYIPVKRKPFKKHH